jgi:hypothetical protein
VRVWVGEVDVMISCRRWEVVPLAEVGEDGEVILAEYTCGE